jgi:hypothetical protein
MPTLGCFSQQYWNGNRHTNQVIVPLKAGGGGYPLWQSSVAFGLFPMEALRTGWAKVRWCASLVRLVWRIDPRDRGWLRDWIVDLPAFTPQERYVYDELRHLMASPLWPVAQHAVKATATTQGFNEPKFWKSISAKVHTDPGHAAQLFRHLHAVQQLQEILPALSSHQRNLVIEAAYHAFTQIPKRTV